MITAGPGVGARRARRWGWDGCGAVRSAIAPEYLPCISGVIFLMVLCGDVNAGPDWCPAGGMVKWCGWTAGRSDARST